MTRPRTLYEKIWDAHVVEQRPDGTCLIFIDRHLVHEVTSPQAFAGLRASGRTVRRTDLTLAVPDHNLPTTARKDAAGNKLPIADAESAAQLAALEKNAPEFGIRYIDAIAPEQGIVHVVGPEQGFSLPGTTIVCGDSHTACHGGIGALAFGIGTSEVEHILATQTLALRRPKTMRIWFDGALAPGVSAKDLILHTIGKLGIDAGTGHAIEYAGPAIRALAAEARLTVCNLSIELGARLGVIAPDDVTFAYLDGRDYAPRGAQWDAAVRHWRTLATEDGAAFDKSATIDARDVAPQITWGTTQQDVVGVDGAVPDPGAYSDTGRRGLAAAAIGYMGLAPGQKMEGLPIDVAFIGSCTNGRLSDLKAAAELVRGRRVADGVRALVVPGSTEVKRQAEALGLDRVFADAGFQWRAAGCSMCLSINGDVVAPGQRCIATSNRNFEGRQ
ncbi:MAG: 3-isopropylmalate dehydratase large subunit, partial [Sphingopyxis sp.]|nr:3-isopropylmalate dehydratase large subunit [Sphingopyxis sp.]